MKSSNSHKCNYLLLLKCVCERGASERAHLHWLIRVRRRSITHFTSEIKCHNGRSICQGKSRIWQINHHMSFVIPFPVPPPFLLHSFAITAWLIKNNLQQELMCTFLELRPKWKHLPASACGVLRFNEYKEPAVRKWAWGSLHFLMIVYICAVLEVLCIENVPSYIILCYYMLYYYCCQSYSQWSSF